MSNKMQMKIENEILGSIIRDLTDEGYNIEIENLGGIANIIAYDPEKTEEDENGKECPEQVGWVKFIWGNAEDCINDYTTNLEKTIKPSLDLSETYRD